LTRGSGELQKKQILETHYKILRLLHKRRYRNGRPLRVCYYSYEQLWKSIRPRIHRNILRRRLDELVSNWVIARRRYRRPHRRLSNHYVYYVDEMTWLKTSKTKIRNVYYPPPIDKDLEKFIMPEPEPKWLLKFRKKVERDRLKNKNKSKPGTYVFRR